MSHSRAARPTGELPVADLLPFQVRLATVFAAPFPVLLTPRLRLRALRDEDAASLHAIFADPEDARYMGAVHKDISETVERVRRNRDLFAAGEGLRWALTLRGQDDTAVGSCGHWQIMRAHRRSEIGYDLRREYRGQGLMHEALCALLGFGFDVIGLHSVEAQADARNAASRRVLERAGFVYEGYQPENYIVGDLITDGVLYGLRAPEFRRRPGGAGATGAALYELEAAPHASDLETDLARRPTLPPLGPGSP